MTTVSRPRSVDSAASTGRVAGRGRDGRNTHRRTSASSRITRMAMMPDDGSLLTPASSPRHQVVTQTLLARSHHVVVVEPEDRTEEPSRGPQRADADVD